MILFPAPYFYSILGVNFLDHDASLEYDRVFLWAQPPMRVVVVIEGVDTSFDDDRKSWVFSDTGNGVNGKLYANINFVVARAVETAK